MKGFGLKQHKDGHWKTVSIDPEATWIHLDGASRGVSRFLQEELHLSKLVTNALTDPNVRPRFQTLGSGELIIVRTVSQADPTDAEQFASVRLWVTENRLISVSMRPAPVVEQVCTLLLEQPMPLTSAIVTLLKQSIQPVEELSMHLQEQVDLYEDQALGPQADPTPEELSELSRQGLFLRRHLAPLLRAFQRLYDEGGIWLDEAARIRIGEMGQKIKYHLEEVDLLKERSQLVRSYVESHIQEEMNRRLYIFSVAAVIFLPLSFITGLFGINVGGIPGAEQPLAFLWFCVSLIGMSAALIAVLKRFGWL